MIIRKGEEGSHVKEIRKLLGMEVEPPVYDEHVEEEVKKFQENKGLLVDGLMGPNTYSKLLTVTTDLSYHEVDTSKGSGLIDKGIFLTEDNLRVYRRYFSAEEYVSESSTDKHYIFLHHTAGSEDPFATIRYWDTDDRGRIGTQFCIGGISRDGDDTYDGDVVEAFPDEHYAWHLGDNGSHYMHTHSVGIELTNWGWLKEKNGKFYNYLDYEVPEDQVIELPEEFRGYKYYHKYTDKQIESLRLLLNYLSNKHDIDISKGLNEYICKFGNNTAFGYHDEVYNGKKTGLLTHTNVRKDKFDCSPQDPLVDLIITL